MHKTRTTAGQGLAEEGPRAGTVSTKELSSRRSTEQSGKVHRLPPSASEDGACGEQQTHVTFKSCPDDSDVTA